MPCHKFRGINLGSHFGKLKGNTLKVSNGLTKLLALATVAQSGFLGPFSNAKT